MLSSIKQYFTDLYDSVRHKNKVPRLVLREYQEALSRAATTELAHDSVRLQIARSLYRHPYLLYHKTDAYEQRRHERELESIIKDAVDRINRESEAFASVVTGGGEENEVDVDSDNDEQQQQMDDKVTQTEHDDDNGDVVDDGALSDTNSDHCVADIVEETQHQDSVDHQEDDTPPDMDDEDEIPQNEDEIESVEGSEDDSNTISNHINEEEDLWELLDEDVDGTVQDKNVKTVEIRSERMMN